MTRNSIHVFAIFGLIALLSSSLYAADNDRDGLPDEWQAAYGFTTNAFAPKLTAWWQMDDTSKTNVIDRSSSGLNGTLVNFEPSPFELGLFGNALVFAPHSQVQFDGTNAAWNVSKSFTFSSWYKGTNAVVTSTVAHWRDEVGNSWQVDVSIGGTVAFLFEPTGRPSQVLQGTANTMNVNDQEWHHIAAVFDADRSQAVLYVDGTAETNAYVEYWEPGPTQAFSLGNLNPDLSLNRFTLDEVRFYHAALSSDEILELPATYSDPDGDGICNLYEYLRGTNPRVPDAQEDRFKVDVTPPPSVLDSVHLSSPNPNLDFRTSLALRAETALR